MKPLRVEFDMTREDMLAATDVLADRDPGIRLARRKAQRAVAVVVLVVVALEAVLFAQPGPGPSPAGLAFTGTAVLFLVWCCPTRHTMRRALRKQTDARLGTEAGRAYLGPRSVEVGRDDRERSSRAAHTLIRGDASAGTHALSHGFRSSPSSTRRATCSSRCRGTPNGSRPPCRPSCAPTHRRPSRRHLSGLGRRLGPNGRTARQLQLAAAHPGSR